MGEEQEHGDVSRLSLKKGGAVVRSSRVDGCGFPNDIDHVIYQRAGQGTVRAQRTDGRREKGKMR